MFTGKIFRILVLAAAFFAAGFLQQVPCIFREFPWLRMCGAVPGTDARSIWIRKA